MRNYDKNPLVVWSLFILYCSENKQKRWFYWYESENPFTKKHVHANLRHVSKKKIENWKEPKYCQVLVAWLFNKFCWTSYLKGCSITTIPGRVWKKKLKAIAATSGARGLDEALSRQGVGLGEGRWQTPGININFIRHYFKDRTKKLDRFVKTFWC